MTHGHPWHARDRGAPSFMEPRAKTRRWFGGATRELPPMNITRSILVFEILTTILAADSNAKSGDVFPARCSWHPARA